MAIVFALPRTVKIVNSKLTLLYWVLFVGVLCGTVAHFFASKQYLSRQGVQAHTSFVLLPSFPKYEDMKEGMEHAIRNSDFCLSPERYRWPMGQNITCLALCPQGLHHWDCIQKLDLFEELSGERLFIVTMAEETFFQSTSSPQIVPHKRMYWTLPSRNLSIDLMYAYSVLKVNPWARTFNPVLNLVGHSIPDTVVQASSMGGAGMKGLRTIILDAKGQFWRAVSPGSTISLTVSDLLELSGDGALLDRLNQDVIETLEDGEASNLVFQSTGAKLRLDVTCSNGQNPDLEGLELPKELDLSSMCSLRVSRLPIAYAFHASHSYIEGGYLARRAAGLDITCSYSGKFEYVDASQIFISLMACTVALGFPCKALLFISLHCLGRLSRMYRRVLVHDFDISDQVAGAAARIALFSSSYGVLGEHVKTNRISLLTFRERLQLVLGRDPRLSEEEIVTMAGFCFGRSLSQASKEVPNAEGLKSPSVLGKGLKLMGMKTIGEELGIKYSQRSDNSSESMCLEDFCSACCHAETFSLTDMAKFFDKDRKLSFFERLFTPASFLRAVHDASEANKAQSDSDVRRCDHGTSSDHGGSAAEDVKALATSLSVVLDRLSAAELRLAESERSGMAWKQQSSDLGLAMGQIEKRLQELEGRIESGGEIQAKRALCDDILSAASPDSKQTEQGLLHPAYIHKPGAASKDVTQAWDALTDRVAMLERRMAIVVADLFDMAHDEKRLGLTLRPSHESRSLPPAQGSDIMPERAHGDHCRGTGPSSTGSDEARAVASAAAAAAAAAVASARARTQSACSGSALL